LLGLCFTTFNVSFYIGRDIEMLRTRRVGVSCLAHQMRLCRTPSAPLPPPSDSSYLGSSTRFTNTTPEVLESLEQGQLTHVLPARVGDHAAIVLVRLQRWVADRFARERYLHRATVLKVVAPCPAFAAAVVKHFSCLVRGRENTTARTLLSEAENHQQHLHILMQLAKPNPAEIVAIYVCQVVQFFIYLTLFTVAPRFAHRLVGYTLEESAVMYTHMINDIDAGKVGELPGGRLPDSAFKYWGMSLHTPDEASMSPSDEPPVGWSVRHLALLIRADEMEHRDNHHKAANLLDDAMSKSRTARVSRAPEEPETPPADTPPAAVPQQEKHQH
jgi:ubiquinol oxidase